MPGERFEEQGLLGHALTRFVYFSLLGHPNKMFRFPSPDRPNFLEK